MRNNAETAIEAKVARLEGAVKEGAVDRVLKESPWHRGTRRTTSGTVNIFTRKVSLLEKARLNPDGYQNHQHVLGFSEVAGAEVLTYLTLRSIHADDLRRLANIDQELSGNGEVRPEDLDEIERSVLDRLWLPRDMAREELGMIPSEMEQHLTRLTRRFQASTRNELLVIGLKEGFLDIDLEPFKRDRWPRFTPTQSVVLRWAHLRSPDIGRAVGISADSAKMRLRECYAKTKTRTRGELILAALANGECRLDEFRIESKERGLTELEHTALGMVDQPVPEVAEKVRSSDHAVVQVHKELRSKLGLRTHDQLIAYAFLNGHIENTVDRSLADTLTEDERQLVSLTLLGNEKIGKRFGVLKNRISQRTRPIRRAVGATDRREFVLFGLRSGLIDDTYLYD
jgi:DNA-binding CsgD family transcriptional regulator